MIMQTVNILLKKWWYLFTRLSNTVRKVYQENNYLYTDNIANVLVEIIKNVLYTLKEHKYFGISLNKDTIMAKFETFATMKN